MCHQGHGVAIELSTAGSGSPSTRTTTVAGRAPGLTGCGTGTFLSVAATGPGRRRQCQCLAGRRRGARQQPPARLGQAHGHLGDSRLAAGRGQTPIYWYLPADVDQDPSPSHFKACKSLEGPPAGGRLRRPAPASSSPTRSFRLMRKSGRARASESPRLRVTSVHGKMP